MRLLLRQKSNSTGMVISGKAPAPQGLTKARYASEQAKLAITTKDRQFIGNRIGVPIHRFSDTQAYLQTGCRKVWATFRACHIVASVVTSTVFSLVRASRDGSTTAPITSGPVYDLWNNPNHWDSLTEMLYQWVFHMKLTGRAYWVKDRINSKGQPEFIYPLLPQHVVMITHPTLGVSKYEYRVNGNTITFLPEEMIYFRRVHPADSIMGMGDIEPSQDLYSAFINRNKYEEKFLENGAQPSGVLTYKGSTEAPADMGDMADDEWGKLKKWWQAEYGGKNNAGKTAMLSGEWDYTRLGLTQQEMSAIEHEKFSIEQIFMNHGVPLSLAGWTNAANYATARQDEINFRKYEIVPLIDLLIGKLNSDGVLFHNFDPTINLKYELSGLIDVEQVHKDYLPLLRTGGLTPNQLRKLMGLGTEENPLLDQYYIESSLVPLDVAGAKMPSPELIDSVLAGDRPPKTTPPTDSDPAATEPGVDPIDPEQSADPQVTLNGAQIQALVDLAISVAAGDLPKDTAVQIIAASFPFTEERAARILEQVVPDSKPKPVPPQFPPPTPPASPEKPVDSEEDDQPNQQDDVNE